MEKRRGNRDGKIRYELVLRQAYVLGLAFASQLPLERRMPSAHGMAGCWPTPMASIVAAPARTGGICRDDPGAVAVAWEEKNDEKPPHFLQLRPGSKPTWRSRLPGVGCGKNRENRAYLSRQRSTSRCAGIRPPVGPPTGRFGCDRLGHSKVDRNTAPRYARGAHGRARAEAPTHLLGGFEAAFCCGEQDRKG